MGSASRHEYRLTEAGLTLPGAGGLMQWATATRQSGGPLALLTHRDWGERVGLSSRALPGTSSRRRARRRCPAGARKTA
jgi:hypothetical protein